MVFQSDSFFQRKCLYKLVFLSDENDEVIFMKRSTVRVTATLVLLSTLFVPFTNCSQNFESLSAPSGSNAQSSTSDANDDSSAPTPPPPTDPMPPSTPGAPPPPGSLGPDELSAILTLPSTGVSYEFRQSQGVRLSDYVGVNFTQANIRSQRTDFNQFPMTVFFRPDISTSRFEVVVEWGRIFNDTNYSPRNLENYVLYIYKGSQLVHQQSIAKHYWLSRWRYQSEQRPVVRTRQDLIAQKFVLNYASGILPGLQPRTTSPVYVPMGFAGFYPDMGATGERDELGMLTEPQAEYLITGNTKALETLIAHAEAINTFKIVVRDPDTGTPLSFSKYPTAHWYDNAQGSSYWIQMVGGYDNRYELAHQPAASYLPYLLTDDPYYLEALQFQANWVCGGSVPGYRGNGKCLFPEGQTRSYAWGVRDIMYAFRASPTTANNADWFLPRTYYSTILDENRQHFLNRFVNATAASLAVTYYFQTATRIQQDYGVWQEEFLATAFGLAVELGREDYRPLFEWKIKSTLARTSGTSGWIRACPTPYYIRLDGHTNWSQAWAANLTTSFSCPYADPDRLVSWGAYEMYTHGSLSLARSLGVPGALANYNWLNAEALRLNSRSNYKWSIAPRQ